MKFKRGLQPHDLFQECRKQPGIGTQTLLQCLVSGQQAHGRTQEAGSGLTGGAKQDHQHAHRLLPGDQPVRDRASQH